MIRQVEISSFDSRFEAYRLRNQASERILLASISEKGARDPLQGVDVGDTESMVPCRFGGRWHKPDGRRQKR